MVGARASHLIDRLLKQAGRSSIDMPLQFPANLIVIVADPGWLFRGRRQKQKRADSIAPAAHYEKRPP